MSMPEWVCQWVLATRLCRAGSRARGGWSWWWSWGSGGQEAVPAEGQDHAVHTGAEELPGQSPLNAANLKENAGHSHERWREATLQDSKETTDFTTETAAGSDRAEPAVVLMKGELGVMTTLGASIELISSPAPGDSYGEPRAIGRHRISQSLLHLALSWRADPLRAWSIRLPLFCY